MGKAVDEAEGGTEEGEHAQDPDRVDQEGPKTEHQFGEKGEKLQLFLSFDLDVGCGSGFYRPQERKDYQAFSYVFKFAWDVNPIV